MFREQSTNSSSTPIHKEVSGMRDPEVLRNVQNDAEAAKTRLISLVSKLEEEGFVRKANSLRTIIMNLEIWQNTR